MNRSKKLVVLLSVLAAAGLATFALTRIEQRQEQISEAGELILEVPTESVQSLSWEYEENSLSFHKNETWLYDGDETFPVSEEKLDELLEPFQSLSAAFVIENVEDFAQYGLETPLCTIHLSTEAQTYEITLGDYSLMDSQRYASLGDGSVYLVTHDPLDEYAASLSDLIAHDELPAFDHVTSIQFEGAETYSITYEEDSQNTYSDDDLYFAQLDGKTLPLDTAKVENYLQTITNLTLTNYVSYNVTEEELQAYALTAPALTVTVDFTAEDADGTETTEHFTLHLSPDPEAAADGDGEASDVPAYVRVGDSQIVYQVSASTHKKLAAVSADDLRHSELFWADLNGIQQLDVTLEGSTYTFTPQQDEDTWLYEDTEFDPSSLRANLRALLAEEFTSEQPTGQEELTLTVHLDNEHFPQVKITLYRYDGTHCLAAVDGAPTALVSRSDTVSLIEAIHAVVLTAPTGGTNDA